MQRHEMLMCIAATVVAVGCGGAAAGDGKTGMVQASVVSAPGISSAQPEPGDPSTLVRLQLTAKEIEVHVVGEPDDSGQWLTIAGEQRIDLSSGIPTEITFAPTEIPAGRITQTRLILEGDATLWIGSEQITVKCPSCSTSGLKLRSRDEVIVPPGGAVSLKLMFDLGMLGQKHGGSYQLGPVVRVEASALPLSPTMP